MPTTTKIIAIGNSAGIILGLAAGEISEDELAQWIDRNMATC
ncbi:MAG: hypothetical protein ABR956_05900 [Terracidiphilus sp.]|jgi:hypothetical protein